jgi:predicted nucleic acid-binding protein
LADLDKIQQSFILGSWLEWLTAVLKFCDDIPPRKTVRRGPKDDPFVMAATAIRANYIVSYHPRLLDLQKPHGVSCVTPRAFLSAIFRER